MRIRHCVLTALLGTALLGLAACNRAADDWKTAQAADTSEAYQQFLKQHQDSEFATGARARMGQLAEDREWQAASGQDTQEGYEQFLAQHADGKWSQEARARIENFRQSASTPASAVADAAPAVAAAAPAATPTTAAPVAPAAAPAKAAPAPASSPSKAAAAPAAAPSKAAAAAKPADKPIHVATVSGSHYAQLGAYSTRERAEQEWKSLRTRLGAELGSLQPHYTTGKSGSQLLYRLQVGMASAEQVADLCARLRKHSQACIPAKS